MEPRTFIDRLKVRCAQLAIGNSTLRGKGTSGSAAAARQSLAAIDLATLVVEDRPAFRQQLIEVTRTLKASLPQSGRAWGRARKAVNIFLRDVVYNADLRDHYDLSHVREWLEVPLDSHVARGLSAEPEGASLPRWQGVKYLRPDVSKQYQAVASAVAKRYGVCRVDLDVFYWRADQDAERLGSPVPAGVAAGTGEPSRSGRNGTPMPQVRSDDMIRVAYYFGRYDATREKGDSAVPRELAQLGISHRAEAIELFRAAVGASRSAKLFRNSLGGDIRYIATTLRDGNPLGESRRVPVGALLHSTDAEVWEAIRPLIATELLPAAR